MPIPPCSNIDWRGFDAQATTGNHTDIKQYTSSVLGHINSCINKVTSHRTIITFPNRKPWMNSEVRLLLKARNPTFRSGDPEMYSASRTNLRRTIRNAKRQYHSKIEDHFHNSDLHRI